MFINALFELFNTFDGMLEDLCYLWVVSSFPAGSPANLQHFVLSDQVAMNISEVEGVSTVLRNILHMHVDVMNCLTHVAVVLAKFTAISHHEIWLHLRIGMNPNIYEGI